MNPNAIVDLQMIVDNLSQSIPQISVDCVVFGFHNNELKVLLSKYPDLDLWALQGGYIRQTEDIDHAAKRVLAERTGLHDIFLTQFHVFGKTNRPTIESLKHAFKNTRLDIDAIPFLKQRFISIGYYSLVDFVKVIPKPALFFENCQWFDIHNLPTLAFDHTEIIQKALESLRLSLDYSLVGFNLMPEIFTMNELQKLYETILGEQLSRNNFQRKILDMGILERLEKKFTGGAHKAPYLYRFKIKHPFL
jgi:8-oxo-dGTP diphosphatase